MQIQFIVMDPDGAQVASGGSPTDAGELGSLANVGHVVRLLRAGNVVLMPGQRLTVWIDDYPSR